MYSVGIRDSRLEVEWPLGYGPLLNLAALWVEGLHIDYLSFLGIKVFLFYIYLGFSIAFLIYSDCLVDFVCLFDCFFCSIVCLNVVH